MTHSNMTHGFLPVSENADPAPSASSSTWIAKKLREDDGTLSKIHDGIKDHWIHAKEQFSQEKYIHKICTNIAYYMHTPSEPLKDVGFMLVPALSRPMQIFSEVMFFTLLISAILFILSPFIKKFAVRGRFTVIVLARFMTVLMMCQILRCVCFLVTSLPGPNYHCRIGASDYNPPKVWTDFFLRTDAFFGCGDLVFSSHTIFVTLCGLTIQKYGQSPLAKKVIWCLVGVFAVLVVAARKHYTLDVFVALYTVPLVWLTYDYNFPDKVPSSLLQGLTHAHVPLHSLSLSTCATDTEEIDDFTASTNGFEHDLELQAIDI